MRLNGAGQAGLLIRASKPGIGADAHQGYYVGIESSSGNLIIGKQNYGYSGLALTAVTGGVTVNTWYHLQARIIGCSITATVKSAASATVSSTSATDAGCFANGQVGVRSHLSNASFRNVGVVAAATGSVGAYADSWASGAAADWTSYGGTWVTSGGNATQSQTAAGSDGAKQILGTVSGDNATVAADVSLTSLTSGAGNAGVAGRVTSPTVGPDAYIGYYAGIDGTAGALVLGRANNGWTGLAFVPLAGGVVLNQWYHVTLRTAAACAISATAQSTRSWDQTQAQLIDPGCPTAGAVSIRTFDAKAGWRNFTVEPG